MWKLALAGTTALAMLASAPAFAEQQTPATGTEHGQQHSRFSEQDFQAFTDARVAAIKAGLKLTPEQEKNWPPVEQAIRDLAKTRYEHRVEHHRDQQQGADAIERLRERADALGQT